MSYREVLLGCGITNCKIPLVSNTFFDVIQLLKAKRQCHPDRLHLGLGDMDQKSYLGNFWLNGDKQYISVFSTIFYLDIYICPINNMQIDSYENKYSEFIHIGSLQTSL